MKRLQRLQGGIALMAILKEVAEARSLMTEAKDWPVIKWLSEKKRVRKVADLANATLDRVEQELHDSWDAELSAAYNEKNGASKISPEVAKLASSIREKHEAALAARADAEATFDKAERRLSTSLAREGCAKAIAGWDFHEEAIRKAEMALAKE
jgi:uncharacterized coiled-coil DUF342 family protein